MVTHLLVGPILDWSLSRLACSACDAQQATWDRALVTCPACLDGTRPHDAMWHPRQQPGLLLPGVQTEKQWMQQVLTLARAHGWLAFHPYNSQKSAPGWPDLVLARQGDPLYVIELKLTHGVVSGQQQRWLDTLRQTTGLVVDVWRPEQFATIVELLV